MALVECPECDHQVSDNARQCPQCGTGLTNKAEETFKLVVILGSALFLFIIFIIAVINGQVPTP